MGWKRCLSTGQMIWDPRIQSTGNFGIIDDSESSWDWEEFFMGLAEQSRSWWNQPGSGYQYQPPPPSTDYPTGFKTSSTEIFIREYGPYIAVFFAIFLLLMAVK